MIHSTINHRGLLRKLIPSQFPWSNFLDIIKFLIEAFLSKSTRKIAIHRRDKQIIFFPKKIATDLTILIFFYTRQIIFSSPYRARKVFSIPIHEVTPKVNLQVTRIVFLQIICLLKPLKRVFFYFVVSHDH